MAGDARRERAIGRERRILTRMIARPRLREPLIYKLTNPSICYG